MAAPPIVSKRNHFNPADELVENAMIRLPDEFKHPGFREWLLRFTETTIKHIAADFGLAAQRGIEQAANLLCDPDFYETKRAERSKWRKRMAEDRARQDWERIERTACPTAEQIAQSITNSERDLLFYQRKVSECEKRLEKLRETTPKNIRIMEPKLTQ